MNKGQGGSRGGTVKTSRTTSQANNSAVSGGADINKDLAIFKTMKAPAVGSSNAYKLSNGDEVLIHNARPGYGTGGILQFSYKDKNGLWEERSRQRYGGAGYANAGTKASAFKGLKESIELYIKYRYNKLR